MSDKSIRDSIREAKAAAGELTTEAASELFSGRETVRRTTVDDIDDLTPWRTPEAPFGANTTWLNVTPDGLTIGEDTTTVFGRLTLGLDMAEVRYCWRIDHGNPVRQRTTFDHISDSQGGLWAETMHRVGQADPHAQEYHSADLPFIVIADITSRDGTVLIETGKRLGRRLRAADWRTYAALINRMVAENLNPEYGTHTIAVIHKSGSLRFELLTGPTHPGELVSRVEKPFLMEVALPLKPSGAALSRPDRTYHWNEPRSSPPKPSGNALAERAAPWLVAAVIALILLGGMMLH